MKVASIEKDNKRIIWLDFVKFIAISMMIAVHCTDNVTPTERSEAWYNLWGSFYGSFMRPAIPLFVMVTGALLLPVKENISTFYYYCPIKILQSHKIRADFICEVSPFSLDFSRQTIKSNYGQKYTF